MKNELFLQIINQMNYSINLSNIVLICGMKLWRNEGIQQEYFIDYFNWIETVEQVKLSSESFGLNLFYCSLASKSTLGNLINCQHRLCQSTSYISLKPAITSMEIHANLVNRVQLINKKNKIKINKLPHDVYKCTPTYIKYEHTKSGNYLVCIPSKRKTSIMWH